jgi:hypothetical protein
MTNLSSSHVPYAELPSEARVLFFILALVPAARYVTQPPKQSELNPVLETIWNGNQLRLKDLSDSFHMTAVLKRELESFFLAMDVQ